MLLEGMVESDLEEWDSGQNLHHRSLPPCIRHSHCTLEFGRSEGVLHIRWTVIQQRGSHWVRGKNKEVAFGNQWNRFSSSRNHCLRWISTDVPVLHPGPACSLGRINIALESSAAKSVA